MTVDIRFLVAGLCFFSFFALEFFLLIFPAGVHAQIFVDGDRPDDSGDGTSWATARKTIQTRIGADVVDATVESHRKGIEYQLSRVSSI